MFKDAKVGDKVWSIIDGWGTITGIKDGPQWGYPIRVGFDDMARNDEDYTLDGLLYEDAKHPMLFWDEIKFDIPEKPKRLVTKEVECWAVIYPKGERHFFSTKGGAINFLHPRDSRVATVKLTGTYEVEE